MKNREIHLKSRPSGRPTPDNFELVEKEMPSPEDGQILVRNEWMSVDPYMRGRMREGKSYVPPFEIGKVLEGGCVGEVVESRLDGFAAGDHVLGQQGWRDYWCSDGSGVVRIDPKRAPLQAYLGVFGLTGLTAYVGLMEIGQLREQETVFVSAATGAVGSIVCQIAKTKGCRVIGSCGSEKKSDWLKSRAGVDATINYRQVDDLTAELNKLAPSGIGLYFDNVGGDHLEAAIDNMNDFGRVVCCGMISSYNDAEPQPGPKNLFKIVAKRLRLQGFIVRDHLDQQPPFRQEMEKWIEEQKIVWEETITEGLENASQAFIELFGGEKMGKAVVKI